MPSPSFILAIDGHAASGKGTLARWLASHYNLPYLDTGRLYRALGWQALHHEKLGKVLEKQADISANHIALLTEMASRLDLQTIPDGELRTEQVGQAASFVAKIEEVRAALLHYQQDFARQPSGAVLDGRDIGTVICPQADVKLFVTATPKVRAERRFKEICGDHSSREVLHEDLAFQKILSEIINRDRQDEQRSTSPLRKADDALLLDTSKLDIEAAYESARKLVDKKLAG